jgi:hypothetical protein
MTGNEPADCCGKSNVGLPYGNVYKTSLRLTKKAKSWYQKFQSQEAKRRKILRKYQDKF